LSRGQSYKEWVARWLKNNDNWGGALARLIHNDPDFPNSGNFREIEARLKELRASDRAMMVFYASWKMYEADAKKRVREANLENKLVHEVEKRGGICWKFTSPGTRGVPDRIVLAPGGRVAFVEMKAPRGQLEPLQKKRAEQIQKVGVAWYCLRSNQDIADFIREMFGDAV